MHKTIQPKLKDHYPFASQTVARLLRAGRLPGVASVHIEPDYGYVVRLVYTNGSSRVLYGEDLGVNKAAASLLATDKGHTKSLLRSMDIKCADGEEFLMPWWQQAVRRSRSKYEDVPMKTTDDVFSYIESTLSYPVYVKPVDGSNGGGVYRVHTAMELRNILKIYNEQRVRVVMVEAPLAMPDYRIACLDDKLVCAYERIPPTVIGDGKSTVGELISRLQDHHKRTKRDVVLSHDDTRIRRHLQQQDRTLNSVPDVDEVVSLMSITNLSAGGSLRNIADILHPRWVELAMTIAKNFDLRMIGLDLACTDITSPTADYGVIEINAAPGFAQYSSFGDEQREVVDQLYIDAIGSPSVG